MSTEFIIILILFAYIAYLHFQLNKKNVLLEKLIDNQSKLGIDFDDEKIAILLKRLLKTKEEKASPPTKLFDEDVLKYLIEDIDTQYLFFHYTKDESVAENILTEGFRFAESFYKTAEPVSNDKSDLLYKHYLRKNFGKYVILIGISKNVYNKYLEQVTLSKKMVTVEQLISKKSEELDDNLEEVYILPPQFVKGYVNSETGKITENTTFNSRFDPPYATDNANKLL